MNRNVAAVFALGVLLALAKVQAASAWTDAGHRIVAQIATEHLTPGAQQEVGRLLALQGAASLPDVSMWADLAKAVPFLTQPSHVVHMPLDGRPYDPDRDCRNGRCALAALAEHESILGDPGADAASRATALNMVVHLVGDLHQPLHTSADTGQRSIVWRGRTMTLHRFWDEEIVAARNADWRTLAAAVGAGGCADAGHADAVAWAEEGRDIARDAILSDPRVAGSGRALPEDHAADAWPVAEKRLRLAGCRLAALLNHLFPARDG